MREETRFIAEDGKEFKTKKECLFYEWYPGNELWSEGAYVDFEALIEWVNRNSDKVTLIFKGE